MRRLRAELASSHLDNVETDALVERAWKLEAANKQLQEKMDAQVRPAKRITLSGHLLNHVRDSLF